jgi:hypothetical protein
MEGNHNTLKKTDDFWLCLKIAIWVGFLKQPALPGEAPPKKNSSKKF